MKPNLIFYRFIVTFTDVERNNTRNFMLGVWATGYIRAWNEIIERANYFHSKDNAVLSVMNIRFYDVSSKEREEYEIR